MLTVRNWGVREYLVAACLGLVATGAVVGLLVWNRQAFLLALAVGMSHYLAYKLPNRNLLAELKAASERLAAFNGSESRDDLAALGPISPAAGTRTVDLYDQDDLIESTDIPRGQGLNRLAQAIDLHLGQACGWWDGTTDCGDPAEGWTRWADGDPVWLCGVHLAWAREQADDDASGGPRSLPKGRWT